MDRELIRAHLSLFAVLQNLENLVVLDPGMAELTKDWARSIQFNVRNGPAAYVEFRDGVCRHAPGKHPQPDVKLFFLSPAHLNAMFDGTGTPIPLKGLTQLGFLKGPFARLTDRLEYYLKPEDGRLDDTEFKRVNTVLTLYTALYAVKELAALEPTCKKVAAHIPNGALQIGVLPDGPHGYLSFDDGAIQVGKGPAERPMATMLFRDIDSAAALLSGELDAFRGVAEGRVMLHGLLPMIDNVGLILDRVEGFLT